jgi:hypothetical protein
MKNNRAVVDVNTIIFQQIFFYNYKIIHLIRLHRTLSTHVILTFAFPLPSDTWHAARG